MNRRQITGYAPWQLWDFAIDRGIPLVFVGGLLGLATIWPMSQTLEKGGVTGTTLTRQLLEMAASQEITILVVIAIGGIIANDRFLGHYRFLFSKPVGVPAYYALQFVVALVGLLAATLVLLSAFWLTIGWIAPWPVLAMVVITYLSVGGTGFFFSAFTRFDWALLIVLWTFSHVFHEVFPNQWWYQALRRVLPPGFYLEEIREAIFRSEPVDFGALTWLIGYGLLFFAAGLFVLQRKAIAD